MASLPVKTTEAKKTGFRLEAGGSHGWGDGRYALRASAGYAARGNSEIDGEISFEMRF